MIVCLDDLTLLWYPPPFWWEFFLFVWWVLDFYPMSCLDLGGESLKFLVSYSISFSVPCFITVGCDSSVDYVKSGVLCRVHRCGKKSIVLQLLLYTDRSDVCALSRCLRSSWEAHGFLSSPVMGLHTFKGQKKGGEPHRPHFGPNLCSPLEPQRLKTKQLGGKKNEI